MNGESLIAYLHAEESAWLRQMLIERNTEKIKIEQKLNSVMGQNKYFLVKLPFECYT